MYDYEAAVKDDIRYYIEEHEPFDKNDLLCKSCRSTIQDRLYEEMFICDYVTGNASGSYTFNSWEAEENLCHNLNLLQDACWEFGDTMDRLLESAETADVTIRCYLLGRCLDEVLDELADEALNEGE